MHNSTTSKRFLSPKNVAHCKNVLNIYVKSYQSKMYRETDTKQFENCHFQ